MYVRNIFLYGLMVTTTLGAAENALRQEAVACKSNLADSNNEISRLKAENIALNKQLEELRKNNVPANNPQAKTGVSIPARSRPVTPFAGRQSTQVQINAEKTRKAQVKTQSNRANIEAARVKEQANNKVAQAKKIAQEKENALKNAQTLRAKAAEEKRAREIQLRNQRNQKPQVQSKANSNQKLKQEKEAQERKLKADEKLKQAQQEAQRAIEEKQKRAAKELSVQASAPVVEVSNVPVAPPMDNPSIPAAPPMEDSNIPVAPSMDIPGVPAAPPMDAPGAPDAPPMDAPAPKIQSNNQTRSASTKPVSAERSESGKDLSKVDIEDLDEAGLADELKRLTNKKVDMLEGIRLRGLKAEQTKRQGLATGQPAKPLVSEPTKDLSKVDIGDLDAAGLAQELQRLTSKKVDMLEGIRLKGLKAEQAKRQTSLTGQPAKPFLPERAKDLSKVAAEDLDAAGLAQELERLTNKKVDMLEGIRLKGLKAEQAKRQNALSGQSAKPAAPETSKRPEKTGEPQTKQELEAAIKKIEEEGSKVGDNFLKLKMYKHRLSIIDEDEKNNNNDNENNDWD